MKTITTDFTADLDTKTWLARLHNIDIVINCVGIIREQGSQTFELLHVKTVCALFKACEIAQVNKVIQLSALGADHSASSQYHLSKKKADDYLTTLNLNWIILSPSLVYGQGAASMGFFTALAALPVTPLVDDGRQYLQPISVDDLCLAVIKLINTDRLLRQRIELVGPEPISMRTLFCALKTWLGMKRSIFISIPYKMALVIARVAGELGNTPMSRETLQMLTKGNTGDVSDFIAVTGRTPRALEQEILAAPPLPADIVYAKLYFLLPLLRITLALLWMLTAYVSVFAYPVEQSLAMLTKVGVSAALAPAALYLAAALDFILGLALLLQYRVRLVVLLQITLIISYSILISAGMPELWSHPFGPITKNIPLVVSTLIILHLARK